MIELQMGWLDVVKKAFGSPTKTIKQNLQQHHVREKNSKRRWILNKTCLHETTTIVHDESTTKITSPAYSYSFGKHKHKAALIIQTSFRGYLARRALEALKGVVKLQALVRGHNVRKRAKMTLKCIQALLRVQAQLCDQHTTTPTPLINITEETQLDAFTDQTWRSDQNEQKGLNLGPVTCQRCSLPPSPSYYYERSHQQQNPFSSPSPSRLKPSYMSATASAMARSRIRPQMSRTQGKGTRKRLSFGDLYMNLSDSEATGHNRITERRLSTSSCCKQRVEDEIPRLSVSEERRSWFR